MKFKGGDRVHVMMLGGKEVDFYGTLSEEPTNSLSFKLKNCSNSIYEGEVVWDMLIKNNCDYYTLATEEAKGLRWSDGSSAEGTPIMCDEEDSEEPVIQRIESLDKGEIIAHSIISNRDGDSFTSAHDMIMWLNEIEGMHGENISVKGWNLIFDHVKSSIAPAFFGKED